MLGRTSQKAHNVPGRDQFPSDANNFADAVGTYAAHPALSGHPRPGENGSNTMARYGLLWLLGVPIPILILIWLFGGLN